MSWELILEDEKIYQVNKNLTDMPDSFKQGILLDTTDVLNMLPKSYDNISDNFFYKFSMDLLYKLGILKLYDDDIEIIDDDSYSSRSLHGVDIDEIRKCICDISHTDTKFIDLFILNYYKCDVPTILKRDLMLATILKIYADIDNYYGI